MATRFSLYYQSAESGEYLQKIINAAPQGQLIENKPLVQLPEEHNSGADVIFLEYPEDDQKLDRWIEKVTADPQSPPIFLYLKEITTNSLWKALRLGVKECFTFPIRSEEFQTALNRLPSRAPEPGMLGQPRLISIMGAKGGAGSTFLTANVAYLLGRQYKGQVLVLDLDLRYSQLVYFFDAKPKYTIIDVVENLERLDSSYLQSLLSTYDNCLSFLPGPPRIEEADMVTPAHLDKILRYLKTLKDFRWILLDLSHQIDEITLKALELSDELMIVTTPGIPALSNTKKLLEVFRLLELDELKIDIWLNHWQKQGDLGLAEVENFLGRAVTGTIEADPKLVERSINEGRPMTETEPRHALCRDLERMAARIMGAEIAKTNGSRWSWLKRLLRRS